MLHVQCPGCLTSAFAECSCPAEWEPAQSGHQSRCGFADLDSLVACPPQSGCCQQNHNHGQAASSCNGGHDGPCPEPAACRTWAGQTANQRHPLHDGDAPGDCPGGHCHKDVEGCMVCRPLIVTVMPGGTGRPGAHLQSAGA